MEWLDPRDIIITDENWTKAEINFDFSRPKFEKLISSKSYLTTHGIGASPDNQNTLTSIVHYWDMFVDDKK